ncbi:MAG: M20/M25/M40 family metallo-hydrolase [Planctomycetaceae bacterium]|nr:M20/M25/M40 family metallo-hydrolase [Planctomycetaceae bacterium]
MKTALDYASELIRFDSVSSVSNVAVTDCVDESLKSLGFETERVNYIDRRGVPKSNVIGKRGSGTGGLAYFGHTDVVPARNWKFSDQGPFEPTVREGKLFGRGSTDMKGSVACMLAAAAQLADRKLREPIYICCTADEETGMVGAEQVAANSQLYREIVSGQSRSIIGEPTRLEVVHGHKGGTAATITSRGIAAHSSMNKGINANWKMIPFLNTMKEIYAELESDPQWRNNEFDPPTMSLNIGINDHTPAINITAPQSVCTVYFRAMPGIDVDPLIQRIEAAAAENELELEYQFRATPFYVPAESPFVQECLEFSSVKKPRTVAYGTDAARFGELERCVIFGPGDIAQAHTHDEWVLLEDLERGTDVYRRMAEAWCCS